MHHLVRMIFNSLSGKGSGSHHNAITLFLNLQGFLYKMDFWVPLPPSCR